MHVEGIKRNSKYTVRVVSAHIVYGKVFKLHDALIKSFESEVLQVRQQLNSLGTLNKPCSN